MHLHTLSFSAIGPFPGEHTIDFAELGSGGIFLLEGPTGAGKSTIIDAIVFALYGKVASKGASEDRLRSTHVGPEVESRVDLVFETGHGIYRILRRPAYDRPSKRGSGTVRQNMQVQLWRLTSPEALNSGDQLSTRADEVGAEITRLVGLSREQFVQTIVLPQGEFANFLSAKPEERRGLLQRVFGTEIYERIQAELIEARKHANQQLAGAKARIRSAVDNFAGAAGLASEDCQALTDLIGAGDTAELESLVARHVQEIAGQAAAATNTAETASAERDKAHKADQAAKALLESVERRDNLTGRARTLEAGANTHRDQVNQHEAAIKAGQVAGYLAGADRARHGLASANNDLRHAITHVGWLDPLHLPGTQELEAWQPDHEGPVPSLTILDQPLDEPVVDLASEIAQRQERIARLKRAAELEEQLPGQDAELADRNEELSERKAARAALAQALAERPTARQVLDEKRTTALRAADAVADLTQRLEQAQTEHTSAQQAAELSDKIGQLEVEVTGARTAALESEVALSQLRRARIDGIAGELAEQLRDGEPCVVCGAQEHPAPASLSENHVSATAITQAEQASRKLEQELTTLAERRNKLVTEQARHFAAARERTTTATQAAVDTTRAELAQASAAQRDADQLAQALADFDAATAGQQSELASQDAWLTNETANLRALIDTIAAARAEIAQALQATTGAGEDRNAAGLIEDLTHQIDALHAVTEALAARRRALTEAGRATAEASEALATHGFNDAAHAQAAALTPDALAHLAGQIKEYEAEQTLVTSGLAEAVITELDPDLTVEQAQIDAELAHKLALEAATYSEEANRVASDKNGVRTRAAAAAATITTACSSDAELAEKLAPTLRIANLADASSSDNARALTLGTYVLTRRFEEVLGAANNRLREMSSGRYELQRSIEKESHGGRRLGLALRIVDHNTASHRDPATLSGGETFYVSLCLALGLADIVTAEAGGVDLGTLFVDEGFGSLDPETLDLVMAELGKLRSGGRMVGVVSHVEAMKSTISDRISVRRQIGGSSTLHVLAGTH